MLLHPGRSLARDHLGEEALIMTIEIVSFVFGGILLFVGLLGGGFELKELKIPKVGMGVRAAALVAGVLFICLGLGSSERASSAGTGEPSYDASLVHASTPEEPVDFTLTDELGEGEVSEQVTLLIDGKNVGDVSVNQDYPNSKMTITVPTPGLHSYTAEGTAVVNFQGDLRKFPFAGQGMINVAAGKTYSLRGSISGDTWLVSIEEEQ